MSSDTYWLIRKIGGRYGVSLESASGPTATDQFTRWFDSFFAAATYANSEYSEYGIVLGEGLMDYGGDLPDGDVL